MDREGFRNRMKQYKKAWEENPGLKYWEWKLKYDSAPKPDNMPSQPKPDTPMAGSQLAENRAHRWDNEHYVDQVNTVCDADRHRSWKEPALKTFGNRVKFTYRDFMKPADVKHMNFLKSIGRLGSALKGASIFGEVVQNLFPSEEAELIEDMRAKMGKQNKLFIGLEPLPTYDEGTDSVLDLPLGDIQIKPFKGFYSIFNNAANWLANKKKDEIFGNLPLKEIRSRLYKNMVPWGYANVEERLIETVKNNKPDPLYGQGIRADERDDIFAEYLEIPQQLRRNSTYKVVQSNYKPTKNAGLDEYKTISNLIKVSGEKLIDDLHKKHISKTLASGEHNNGNLTTKINEFEYLPINKNKVVSTFGNLFGPHTIGRGVDPLKGEYVSFYDNWDLAPFGGGKDESNGIGKPVKFYDRLYLDDFYGVSSKPKDGDYYGGYLPEVEIKPKKYDEGGEVTGPPTYEQWDTDTNRYTPTILDNASLYWSMEAAKKDLHNAAMKLPGYAERWAEYYRSLPKTDPDINEFVDELWENENPNNVGLKNGKYYPHKSPEGGAATIGPGFKLGSGSHKITKKQAERGMTKSRLDQEARRIGKQHLNAVDQFINYGQTTNPADTVSPQIKMGLMDLRHLVGPLNEWSSLREAVLNGDIEGIRKESTVTWNDNGKTKVDKRRKKIRDEKYFYYE